MALRKSPGKRIHQRRALGLEAAALATQGLMAALFSAAGDSLLLRIVQMELVAGLILSSAFLAEHSHPGTWFEPPPELPSGEGPWEPLKPLVRGARKACWVLLILAAGFTALESFRRLVFAEHPTLGTLWIYQRPVWLGWIMMIVLASNAGLSFMLERLKTGLGRRLRQSQLRQEARLHRDGWLSSLVAAAGLAGLFQGWWWFEAPAVLAVAGLAAASGFSGLGIKATAWRPAARKQPALPEPEPAPDWTPQPANPETAGSYADRVDSMPL